MPPVLRRRAGDAEVSNDKDAAPAFDTDDEDAASASDTELSDDEEEFQRYVEECKRRRGVFKYQKWRMRFDTYKKQQLAREERAARPKISDGFFAWLVAYWVDILWIAVLVPVIACMGFFVVKHRIEF
jgi:hypothetical protein